MRFAPLFVALALSCTHTPNIRADLESLPERKDSGPKVAVTDRITFSSAVDAESVEVFMLELDAHIKSGGKVIVVELDTPGGSVAAGVDMGKAIEKSPIPVICVVDGMAASMGLYILQSCDIRVMTRRSLLMGHEPSANAYGQSDKLHELAALLQRLNRAMAAHITAKTILTVDMYLEKIAGGKEMWLTADEADSQMFVDFTVLSVDEAIALF